jgi:hypothetical protein
MFSGRTGSSWPLSVDNTGERAFDQRNPFLQFTRGTPLCLAVRMLILLRALHTPVSVHLISIVSSCHPSMYSFRSIDRVSIP